jgi:predicted restriction endonuclease
MFVHIHHLDWDGGNDDPANLVPLCPNHHWAVHRAGFDLRPFVQKAESAESLSARS